MLFLKVNNFFVKYLHFRNAQAVEPDLPFLDLEEVLA